MLVFIAKRPVVISVKSEIRRKVRIIARRYNTSLDLSRPVKVETKNNLQLLLLVLAKSIITIPSRFFINKKACSFQALVRGFITPIFLIFVGLVEGSSLKLLVGRDLQRAFGVYSLAITRDLQEVRGLGSLDFVLGHKDA
ncbi:hypothetical protein PIB30_035571 [Stylosanthes scabra]|uniref:Uncharacterized protein n=1 Tax=Stylosanthes scabra TaxID=79078 RepID=A0ABU6UF04_9FABA|nr:hypothetical protein [Stylosanthes scabra]